MSSSPTLAAILQQIEPPRKVPAPIQPLAQAMELRERFARLRKRHNFIPGDIVRPKSGLGPVPDSQCVVLIVMRILTTSSYDESLLEDYVRNAPLAVTAHVPDLIVGDIYRSEGTTISLSLLCSDLIEPVSDEELMAWTPSAPAFGDAVDALLTKTSNEQTEATVIPLPQDENVEP